MIKFVDENGNIFEGQPPFIHWLKGGQSIGLWYDLKLLIITDNIDSNSPLVCSGLNEDSIFRFVKPESLNNSDLDISEDSGVLLYNYVDFSNNVIEVDNHSYRLYQIHILCKSDKIGQITDSINLSIGDDSVDITIGGDFYTLDETLSINLSNRGLDLSPYIEKSLYDVNVHEANVDSIYINQKFKELVSNYIDIIDCKGSYKSLLNSLEWFDWGDNIEMYEVWKNSSDTDFEKNLELILSDAFKHLIYTQSKTTYVSLVTALTKPVNVFDEEKNPILRNIVRKWSNDDLAIKISVLGAFFERYFLPIHMDLKRASVEAHIYTVQNKIKIGGIIHNDDYLTDSDPVSIDMPHTVVIGNLDGVSVGDNTMFGRVFDPDHYEDFVDDIEFNELYTFNFEDKSVEYWKDFLGYGENVNVEDFVDGCENWAIKFVRDGSFSYNGKVYSKWRPTSGNWKNIKFGIIDEDGLNSNYKYLNSKSVYNNLDNRYAPFSNFLIDINDDDSYEGIQEWIEGLSQTLVKVNKVTESEETDLFNKHTHYTPVGVDYVKNIKIDETNLNSDDIKQATAYGQLIGSVGVVVPVKVSVSLPEGDGLCMEIINLYKDGINNPPIQVINRRLFMSDGETVSFEFNLVSTKLEKVSFTLVLHSLSGHTWTASAGYKVIDMSGCQLDVYKVTNKNYSSTTDGFWDLMKGNPWGTQYNTISVVSYEKLDENDKSIIDPSKYTAQSIIQYLPMDVNNEMRNQYNEYIIVNNPVVDGDYDVSWYTDNYTLSQYFWNIPWGKDEIDEPIGEYSVLVAKDRGVKTYILSPGQGDGRDLVVNSIYNTYNDSHPGGWSSEWNESNIKKFFINRHDYIFIPQLHKYTNMEDMKVDMTRNKYSGEFDFGGYEIQKDKELLCVRPQFNHSVPVDLGTVRWEFKNMTTLETISYDIPISKPTIANNKMKSLGPGYWTVTMYFKMDGNSVEHKIVKNSAFKIV